MKEIKDYLHFYLGSEAITVKTLPERIDGHMIDLVRNGHYHTKPILRPVSSMTVDTAIEVMKEKFQYDNYINFRIENESDIEPAAIYCTGLKKINNIFTETHCTQHISSLSPTQFLRLINAGIDLFGLIEDGLAIDATTLK